MVRKKERKLKNPIAKAFNISEEEFNKRHKKARKDAEPSGKKERKLKNPIAKALKFFTFKRFKDKTKYTRKVKNVRERSLW